MDLVPSCPQVPGNDPALWLPAASCPQVGTNAMDSPLLKYSAKDYFFKAALCHFCIDMLNAKVSPGPRAPRVTTHIHGVKGQGEPRPRGPPGLPHTD